MNTHKSSLLREQLRTVNKKIGYTEKALRELHQDREDILKALGIMTMAEQLDAMGFRALGLYAKESENASH